MKKMTYIILAAVLIVLILVISVYGYFGGFSTIHFKVEKQGGETIVYESVTGDYKNASKYTNKIYFDLLNNDKVETAKGIGIYYDNPQVTDKDKLRSDVGCVIDNPDSIIISKLSNKYQVKTLPEGDFIVAEFPMKGSLSFLIGVIKVYPALQTYCEKQGYKDNPVTEVYDVPGKKIIYRKEVVK